MISVLVRSATRPNAGPRTTAPALWLAASARMSALPRVVDPASREPEQHDGDDEGDGEQEPRQRRAVRHLLEVEEGLVEVQVVEERRAARLSGSVLEDERDEEVLEHLDDAQDDREEDHRR